MKKSLATFLAAGLIISLTACGGNSNTSTQQSQGEASPSQAQEITPAGESAENTAENTGTSDENKEIVFWSMLGGADGDIINEMIEEYNASGAGYTVKHYIQDWGEYYNKLFFPVKLPM